EFDPLADSIGSASEDYDRAARRPWRVVLLVIAAIEIGRRRGELAGTGIDHLVDRAHAFRPAASPHHVLGLAAQGGKLAVGEAEALHASKRSGVDRRELLVP